MDNVSEATEWIEKTASDLGNSFDDFAKKGQELFGVAIASAASKAKSVRHQGIYSRSGLCPRVSDGTDPVKQVATLAAPVNAVVLTHRSTADEAVRHYRRTGTVPPLREK